jgi:phospholipase A1
VPRDAWHVFAWPLTDEPRQSPRLKAGRMQRLALLAALLLLGCRVTPVHAQLASCVAIDDDRARLACYDALARPTVAPGTPAPPAPAAGAPAPATPANEASTPGAPTLRTPAAVATPVVAGGAAEPSALEKRWELRPALRQGAFKLQAYRPLYALVHLTNSANNTPSSPTHETSPQAIRLENIEAKLQLSFKTKLMEDVLGSGTDMWFGYTQRSYWQAANSRYSSPFRETDYQPEVMVIHPLQLQAAGIHARYAGLSLTHESNGRAESLSRSWNRLIGDLAFESGAWSLQVRPWVRVLEASGDRNDNPDIEDYAGRGELIAEYRHAGHVVTLIGRHTLRGGSRSRGSGQIDWAFPLAGALNGHLQIFSGYGENLIDYNHRQTTVGFGVSFYD